MFSPTVIEVKYILDSVRQACDELRFLGFG